MNLWLKLAFIGAIVFGILFGLGLYGSKREKAGYDRAQDEYAAAAELQRETNRSTAREVEEKEAVRTVYRDRFIIQTIKEIEHASAPLASCPLPADTVRLLNAAAQCAKSDRPAACQPDGSLPVAP